MQTTRNVGIVEKLRKIQALINDSKDDHEAQAGMLLFQRLLEKNGITAADVTEHHEEQSTVNETEAMTASRVPTWQKMLHQVIARHFRCIGTTVTYRNKHDGTITYKKSFVGMGSDPEVAAATYQSAIDVANASWKRHIDWMHRNKPYIKANGGHRAQYLQAFADGLDQAYTEQEAALSMSLIIVRDKRVDESIVNQGFKQKTITVTSYDDGSGSRTQGFRNGLEYGRGRSITA